jgi:hypothetical protein
LANVLAMAQCSELAYRDEATIRSGIASIVGGNQRLHDFKFLSSSPTHTQCFMAGVDDAIVICFRGTQSIGDWVQDGQIVLVPLHNLGLTHFGFRNVFESVHAEIEATLH